MTQTLWLYDKRAGIAEPPHSQQQRTSASSDEPGCSPMMNALGRKVPLLQHSKEAAKPVAGDVSRKAQGRCTSEENSAHDNQA